MKKYWHIIIILSILLLTIGLRFYHWEDKFSFNAEYNYKLWPMQELIVEHKPTLIGIEAVSYLHHIHYPPLFLYLFSPILALSNFNPASIELVLIFLSPVTAYIFFLLGRELKNNRQGYIFAFLYGASFLLQRSDRFIWVVGPIIGLTALFLLVLLRSLRQSLLSKSSGFILGFIVGFGLNFHYQIMIMPISFLALLIFQRFRKMITIYSLLFFFSGMILFLLPLVIFDIRHEFYNLVGIKLLLSYASGTFNVVHQFASATNAFSSIFLGFFVPNSNPAALVSEKFFLTFPVLLCVFLLFFIAIKNAADQSVKLFWQFCFIVCIIGITSFGLIRNNFNYYIVFLESIFIVVLGSFLNCNYRHKILNFLSFVILGLFAFLNIPKALFFTIPTSWFAQVKAFDYIINSHSQKPLSIFFEQTSSEEYLFLLYYRAQKMGIAFDEIIYYEPWQDGSNAEFIVGPKEDKEGIEKKFGKLIITQKAPYEN